MTIHSYHGGFPLRRKSFSQLFEGVQIEFGVEVYRIDRDGSMWVRVDARSSLGTPLRIRPSFVFRKLPDGRAYTPT